MSTDPTLARARTVQDDPDLPRQFVPAVLPWIIAGAALVVYVVSLNHWVSMLSLAQVARVSGWLWRPQYSAPLYWLLTLPFQWLPGSVLPLAFNLLSMVCAILTLALLARSVALLPHDRTKAQREKERSPFGLLSGPMCWLPPVLAVLACGLQLSFWESATAATTSPMRSQSSHMLDLLLLAYAIRCLLEYRISERESWLTRASFVFGLAMTNDWAMVGFLPCFIAAQIWIKGLGFFDSRFLLRMFLWGVCGLSLYLLFPLMIALQGDADLSFWTALRLNLIDQKNNLFSLPFNKGVLLNPDNPMIVLGLYSLLPVFLMGVRWTSYFGDTSPMGARLARGIFHVAHAVFLVACIWIMLDPPVSPRNKGSAFGTPFLSLYYLCALAVGYFSGYFLVVFGKKAPSRYGWREPSYMRTINLAVVGGAWLLLLAVPLVLLYRNMPQIRVTNSAMVRNYAESLTESLPLSGAVVLSDDPSRLLLARAALAAKGQADAHLFIDTSSMRVPAYHAFMKREFGDRWPVKLPEERRGFIPEDNLVELAMRLAETNTLFYLHPSFGYYFEVFYMEPRGMAYQLHPYTAGLEAPPLTPDQIRKNEEFWQRVQQEQVEPLITAMAPTAPASQRGVLATWLEKAYLKPAPNRDAGAMASYYSAPLGYWGVMLQRHGRLTNAANQFELALQLNPDNVVAQMNLACNKNLQAGKKGTVLTPKAIEDEFGKHRSWEPLIREYGPFDEANRCYEQGVVFALGKNYRQANLLFRRAFALDPDNMDARLALSEVSFAMGDYTTALSIVQEIRANPKLGAFRKAHEGDLLFVETSSHLAQTNDAAAMAAISSTLRNYPSEEGEGLSLLAARTLVQFDRPTNALAVVEQLLQRAPDSVDALSYKGYLSLRLGDYAHVVPTLTRALELATSTNEVTIDTNLLAYAWLNRAIALFKLGRLDEAKADYENLRNVRTNAFASYYGLAEIAYQQKRTNDAILNYSLYLKTAPTNSEEANYVAARIRELSPGSR